MPPACSIVARLLYPITSITFIADNKLHPDPVLIPNRSDLACMLAIVQSGCRFSGAEASQSLKGSGLL